MSWKDANLTDAEKAFMEDIVSQVPTTMGAQNLFVGILDKLVAPAAGAPKFRYIVMDTVNVDVAGTNSEEIACEKAENEDLMVIDTLTNKWIVTGDRDDDSEILEQK